jgi:DNA (cytosine-5)-methyltransferase 1
VSIEFNEVFCNTLKRNFPTKTLIGPPKSNGDIRQHEEISSLLESIIGTNKPFDGVFHGGPPCQSFSIAANQRFSKNSVNFKRQGFDDEEKGELLFDYLWYIKRFMPRAFLIENVAGIEYCDDNGKVKTALDELVSLGYEILPPKIVNAAYFGVPQNRMRWLIIGSRTNKPIEFPIPYDYVTTCYETFNRKLDGVENHQTREHTAESVSRYMQLAYGTRDKLGRVDRLKPQLPSKSVIAGGTTGGGRSHLHPYSPRTISVRECARLQTFPDSYVFTGATARQFTQVGNAVPPLLAYKIATLMKNGL